MQPLVGFLATEHVRDLHREAQADRLARIAQASRHRPAAWRRHGGAAARRLSAALAAVAISLDPAACHPSYGRE